VVNHVVPALGHIETTPLAFTEGQAAMPVTSSLLPTVIGSNLAGATIAITGNFAGPEDVLAFTPQLGITGGYDAAAGVLTLSGTASWVAYTLALHSVTYVNTSKDPSTATRTISFQVDDGYAYDHASNVVSRNVTIPAVNTARRSRSRPARVRLPMPILLSAASPLPTSTPMARARS